MISKVRSCHPPPGAADEAHVLHFVGVIQSRRMPPCGTPFLAVAPPKCAEGARIISVVVGEPSSSCATSQDRPTLLVKSHCAY